jgi:uncharacterized protein YcbK (DUF882 family)
MGDISKNISQHELDCKCGSNNCSVTIHRDEPVIKIWQDVCNHFAAINNADRVVLEITSGARCYDYNRTPVAEGGPGSNDRSQHPRACAIDARVYYNGAQVPPKEIHEYLDKKYPNQLGLGLYVSSRFNHIDTRRTGKARW